MNVPATHARVMNLAATHARVMNLAATHARAMNLPATHARVMNLPATVRRRAAAALVAPAVLLPASDRLAPEPPEPTAAVSIQGIVNDFLFCEAARLDTMYPPAPFFTFDCMRGAPGSNA